MLSIKGPVAVAEGIRAPYVPSDADLLVEPSELHRMVAELVRLGWRERPGEALPRLLDEHSVTLIHDSWPCDLDLHRRFPGFLAEDNHVFELMWSSRTEIDIAGIACPVPSSEFSWAIAVLNDYRDSWKGQQTRADELLAFARERFAGDDFVQLTAALENSGSVQTLEPAMAALGIHRDGPAADPRALVRWQIRREAGLSPVLPVLVELAEGRLVRAARLSWTLLTATTRSTGETNLDRRPLAVRAMRTLPRIPRWIRLVRRSIRVGLK
ncbi:hypothetical protein Q0F99_00205 [Rathayibacter oskolensis]|nr:hypothetical protein [Rathayibacter oskolensis]WKK71693.1 hypothetical protein Q0F99_00205 [Rathayibacter oskolensis]